MNSEQDQDKCPIYNHENIKLSGEGPLNLLYFVDCPQCGKYKIEDGFRSEKIPYFISAWIREQNENGKIPEINSDNLKRLKKMPIPSVSEKQLLLMQALERRTSYPGEEINFSGSEALTPFIALSWCKNMQELCFLFSSLNERGLIKALITERTFGESEHEHPLSAMITARGWDFLEANRHKGREDSKKVFIAMWFNESMDSASDAIYEAIKETKYEPIRIDRVEHIDRIDDKIIAEIKSSKFLIADLTGHRNGVYYEAGFANGLGIPVIWCVRKDDLEEAHFDVRQFNCIIWNDEKDLKTKLINHIKAVID